MGEEQTNMPNSTNIVEMNFIKKFLHLLSNSCRKKPCTFWTNTFLLVLSIGTLIIIRTNNVFIPSFLNNEMNQLINLCLDFVSALYIVGLVFYLYWEVSPIKKDLILSGIIIFLIFISITVSLLLIPVYNGLRYFILPQMELTLDEFGSFFASITGLLAFLAVLYTSNVADKRAKETIALAKEEADNNRVRAEKAEMDNRQQVEEARNRYIEDSERTVFFQLLELHTKKVDSVVFEDDRASEAFKFYNTKADSCLTAYFVIKELLSIDDARDIKNELRGSYNGLFLIYCPENEFGYSANEFNKFKKAVKRNLDDGSICESGNICLNIHPIISRIVQEKDFYFLYKSIKFVANIMYKESGHILGHYFRNMYYVMDTINNFSDKKNYKELFRAQLSRYELALSLFNAVSSRSSIKMVELLEEFDIFKDLYEEDIRMLKFVKEEGIEPSVLIKNILNEYKKDISNKSDIQKV